MLERVKFYDFIQQNQLFCAFPRHGTSFPADVENLRAIIIEKIGRRRDIPVSSIADGDTRRAIVMASMDTVGQLGFKRLSISAQRPAAGEKIGRSVS